jgi:Arc/MetJ-type ribon-helix-helix transcriptional regulator
MEIIPAKLTPKLLEEVEKLIKEGLYADRDEAMHCYSSRFRAFKG